MNKTLLFCLQWVFVPLSSLGVSNSDFSNIKGVKNQLQEFKLKNSAAIDLRYAFQGLHTINSYGWYLTTAQTIQKINRINIFYNKFFVSKKFECKHQDFDLFLIKFDGFDKNKEITESNFLEYLGEEQDIKEYPWVLSLANVPSNCFENMENSAPIFDGPLQSISQIIDKNEGYLFLNKGKIEDFYSTSISFFKDKKENLIEKRIHQIKESIKETSKHFFAKKYITESSNPKIKNLEKILTNLEMANNIFLNSLDNLYPYKINIGLRPSMDLLNQSINSLKKEIQLERSFKLKLLDYSHLSNDSVVDTFWNKYVENLKEEKKIILRNKKKNESKPFSNQSVDDIWLFNTCAYNGIADQEDIGGGIYGYPQPYVLINDANFPQRNKLFGITIAIEKKGETSIALDLTQPKIRNWIFDTMLEYYQSY